VSADRAEQDAFWHDYAALVSEFLATSLRHTAQAKSWFAIRHFALADAVERLIRLSTTPILGQAAFLAGVSDIWLKEGRRSKVASLFLEKPSVGRVGRVAANARGVASRIRRTVFSGESHVFLHAGR
jgi:hypothetical protein